VALSPDGKTAATGGRNGRRGELTLWDVGTGREITTFALGTGAPQALTFSPDGRFLAAQWDGITVWDVSARKQLATLKGSISSVDTLAFSPDGKRLGVAGLREVQLWDVASGRKVSSFRRLVPVRAGGPAAAFSPDLRTLASPNYQEIDLWDADTGKVRAVLSEHRGRVSSAAWSPDGQTLVAASALRETRIKFTGDVRLWDVAAGRERAVFTEGLGGISAARLSPDGQTLAVLDGAVLYDELDLKLLDVATGRQRVIRHPPGHSFTSVAFTADGRLLVTGTLDDRAIKVKVWEVSRPKGAGR
jgi:WD40 repeat protein